jgi:MFS family permease
MPFALRALSSRNFRLFFFGQLVSQCGSWITTATNSWLIYHISGREVLLGLAAFASQIPAFVLGPLAGVMVDRWDVRRTIIWTQVMALVQSVMLAGLCWSGVLPAGWMVGAIMALQVVQGLINAFDMPARQSFGIQMVDRREDLPNAIALNSTLVNVSRLVGPAMAGLMIATGMKVAGNRPRAGEFGAAWCYTLDAVTYVGVIWALVVMRPRAVERRVRESDFWREFREGLRYVAGYPALRTALLMLCVTSFFGVSFNSQIAAIAKSVLGVGPEGYGLLVGGIGLGATGSALFLATRRSIAGLPRLISYAAVMFAVTLIALSFTKVFVIALMLTPVLGASMVMQTASTNTLLQTLSADDKRGRVMSFFTMSFMGMVPMGALALGSLAEWVGTKWAVLGFGVVVLGNAVVMGGKLREIRVTDPREVSGEKVMESGERGAEVVGTVGK